MDQLQPHRNPAEDFQAAVRAFGCRDWKQAERFCQQVLTADPGHTEALHMLGLVFSETDRSEEAIATLRKAVAQQPENPFQWMNLGILYREAGRFAETVECERNAVALLETFPEAHYNLSLAYHALGQFENAIAAALRAAELRPGYAEAHYYLGSLLLEEGRFNEALAAFQTALQLRPKWPEAGYYMGVAALELRKPAQALEYFREVLRWDPACISAAHSMGYALNALGRVEEARAAFAYVDAAKAADARAHRRGDSQYHDAMSVLFRETLAEVIPPDNAAIAKYRSRVVAALKEFAAKPRHLDLANLHTDGAIPSIMLPYYGGNVRPLMEQYAQAIDPLIPRSPLQPRRGKPKLGIVVTKGHERVFARLWGGIAERLSRELFEISVACSRASVNVLRRRLTLPQAEYLVLPDAIDAAAAVLREREFDWLHYWEIGTDTMNYYLPFFRAAPGQSTCRGWPMTSGNPLVTSYLSCEQLEPPDGQAHYTEQLILLKRLPTYYVPPAARSGPSPRSRFGLDDGQHIYLCAQNLRKFHPEFDPVLAHVLRSDPLGLLLIVADPQASITALLMDRFRRTISDVVSRVRVMPRMEHDEYLALLEMSDVLLDTFHYGGDTTAYDAVAVGAVLVTLPGEFHRTRWCAAINRRLGLSQLIASTPEEYVAKAVEVANNADLRQALRQQILGAGAEVFEDMSVIDEHNAYFSQAIADLRAR